MVTTRAYVDGFNLYRTMLHNRPSLKWLDLTALWAQTFPDLPVTRTYYFTARVRALPLDKGAPARQRRYLDALGATPDVEVVFGTFRTDQVVMRPTAGSLRDRIEVHQTREKGSDVNLASYLLRDAYSDAFDTAIVVSNDSDIAMPIRFVRHAGKDVILYSPAAQPNSSLRNIVSQHYFLSAGRAAAAQFPPLITLPTGRQVHRPREWA